MAAPAPALRAISRSCLLSPITTIASGAAPVAAAKAKTMSGAGFGRATES